METRLKGAFSCSGWRKIMENIFTFDRIGNRWRLVKSGGELKIREGLYVDKLSKYWMLKYFEKRGNLGGCTH